MLNKLKSSYEDLIKSRDFKKWNKKNAYLTNCLLISNEWQFDFYDPDKDKITSFQNNKMSIREQDVFQAEKVKLKELNLDNVDIDLDKALEIIDNLVKEKYSNETVDKKIVILQTIETEIWNITYLTKSFNILNVKIDAKIGELLNETFESILSFKV